MATNPTDKPSGERFAHLFGPVPSRRFGWSLGVDLTPFKTCTLDCVFCQLGRTTALTTDRREHVATNDVVAEIEAWLRAGGTADYITLGGSGEPTLHSRFGEIIDRVHARTSIPVALLTNGTLLHLSEVRDAARRADVVKVTLAAADEPLFAHIHRPCSGVTFDRLVEGECRLREEFTGQLWMEVFLLLGINSTPAAVRRIAAVAARVRPDRIQLNTCVRPSAESYAEAVSVERLVELAEFFAPRAEIVAAPPSVRVSGTRADEAEAAILGILGRRPSTAPQLARACNLHGNEISKYLGRLLQAGQIRAERRQGEVFYVGGTVPAAGGAVTKTDASQLQGE
ncbi:MAG: hypothetical protein A3K19_14540 [Lentisphaerae bacterium RIFOXYB12_FULL_65_16]|nr:MAG: hypothetical protein A3K18_18585 [Lentisphaerae bacterium RIFOXYA12_64_32]OGV87440.1 MAG: hypothetical protein A3K19_14540 [Lentisphaerae bacterium RIFOXYB12_FULL_65_16]